MNAGANRDGGSRTNRRRQSPARALGAAVGRLIGFPPELGRRIVPTPIPAFAASWPRLAIA